MPRPLTNDPKLTLMLGADRKWLWAAAAAREGLPISEWIRRVCDAAAEHRPEKPAPKKR